MTKKDYHHAIINAYRTLIEQRYQMEPLQAQYELPPTFTEERLVRFRAFFLDHLYPPPAQRAELEDAFKSLDQYIKQPSKLLRLLRDSTFLLFKYGRHLPKILGAGIKALQSFRAANAFEDSLVLEAQKNGLQPPYNTATIKQLLSQLSMDKINVFIEQNEALFETLYDRKLVKKILEIVEHLISKMQQRPSVYSEEEVKGLQIGRDIIQASHLLFDELSEEEQRFAFAFIIAVEREVLEELFD